jgi:hypothetical protein
MTTVQITKICLLSLEYNSRGSRGGDDILDKWGQRNYSTLIDMQDKFSKVSAVKVFPDRSTLSGNSSTVLEVSAFHLSIIPALHQSPRDTLATVSLNDISQEQKKTYVYN